jgi:hypothetical protein
MNSKTTTQLNNYLNQWVALSEPDEHIVGSGQDLLQAEADAKARGYLGEITFFKVFPFGQYVPSHHAVSLPKGS